VDGVQLSRPWITSPPIRVVIFAGHVDVRDALVDLLGEDPDLAVAGLAETAAEAVVQAHRHCPDVLLIALDRARNAAVRVISWLSGEMPDMKVIALSGPVDRDVEQRLISVGAHRFFTAGTDVVDSMKGIFPR
jgi:DNA-binding NarL/FixJ family response regulator